MLAHSHLSFLVKNVVIALCFLTSQNTEVIWKQAKPSEAEAGSVSDADLQFYSSVTTFPRITLNPSSTLG